MPVTSSMLPINRSLSDADWHGSAIFEDVEARTTGAIALITGTLYRLIKRAFPGGLILESRRRPGANQRDEHRHYCRLTEFGRTVLTPEARRREQLTAGASAKRIRRTSDAS